MLVAGIYQDPSRCERAYHGLTAENVPPESISIVFLEDGSIHDAPVSGTKAMKAAPVGAGVGAIVGGIAGLFAGVVGLAIPGFGAILAMGPLLTALTGAAVVAAAGGLTGGLVGIGMPKYEARKYETRVKEGGILLSVTGANERQLERAKQVLLDTGAADVMWMTSDIPPESGDSSQGA